MSEDAVFTGFGARNPRTSVVEGNPAHSLVCSKRQRILTFYISEKARVQLFQRRPDRSEKRKKTPNDNLGADFFTSLHGGHCVECSAVTALIKEPQTVAQQEAGSKQKCTLCVGMQAWSTIARWAMTLDIECVECAS